MLVVVTPSGLPELDVARVRRFCADRVPEHVRDRIWVECDVTDRHLTIVECRPPWKPEDTGPEWTRFPIARLAYTKSRRTWQLCYRDRDLRFHRYDRVPPTSSCCRPTRDSAWAMGEAGTRGRAAR